MTSAFFFSSSMGAASHVVMINAFANVKKVGDTQEKNTNQALSVKQKYFNCRKYCVFVGWTHFGLLGLGVY